MGLGQLPFQAHCALDPSKFGALPNYLELEASYSAFTSMHLDPASSIGTAA